MILLALLLLFTIQKLNIRVLTFYTELSAYIIISMSQRLKTQNYASC